MNDPIVRTGSGALAGVRHDGIAVFRGIRYGTAARFHPPEPAPAWRGVRSATEDGPVAPQPVPQPPVLLRGRDAEELFGPFPDLSVQSEDCLHLNVFTPGIRVAALRPTMVMLHSGAFLSGAIVGVRADATRLAREGDVVVVTVAHRLGALGYLELEHADRSGNVGQLDLVLALEWVRDNIEQFGGDPGRVTVFGESGGGAKVVSLLAMPAARGLIHGAICESGMPLFVLTADEAAALAEELLHELGTPPTNASVERIASAQSAVLERGRQRLRSVSWERAWRLLWGFAPVIDGVDLPLAPNDAFAVAAAIDVPLIAGCTSDEGVLLTEILADGDDARAEIARLFGVDVREDEADAELGALVSEHAGTRPTAELLDAYANGGTASVYAYSFRWHGHAAGDSLGAYHAIAAPFFLDVTDRVPLLAATPDASSLAACARSAWSAFAHTGAPPWPPYTADERLTMVFDDECRVGAFPSTKGHAWP
jgi:para-nitrobenzyl esterase